MQQRDVKPFCCEFLSQHEAFAERRLRPLTLTEASRSGGAAAASVAAIAPDTPDCGGPEHEGQRNTGVCGGGSSGGDGLDRGGRMLWWGTGGIGHPPTLSGRCVDRGMHHSGKRGAGGPAVPRGDPSSMAGQHGDVLTLSPSLSSSLLLPTYYGILIKTAPENSACRRCKICMKSIILMLTLTSLWSLLLFLFQAVVRYPVHHLQY